MDFLDPQKQRRHAMVLILGYIVVAVAILIGTIILLYKAYGYGLGKNGEVVQDGFVYVSSAPSGASIRVNGILNSAQTNARLSLVSGTYSLQLDRTDYRSWQRIIDVEGGSVSHYDYPLLIPKQLQTATLKTYDTQPMVAAQSPDRRWLMVQHPDDPLQFDVFDMKNVKPVSKQPSTTITIPSSIVTSGKTSGWQLVEWSNDNQHVLVEHTYDDKHEFLLLDRTDGSQSVNLNQTLNANPTKLTLVDKKYDQYYLYDASSQQLSTATLSQTTLVPYLDHVLTYQSYGSDIMLYASSASSGTSKVSIDLLQGGKTYALKEVPAGTNYLLDLTQYNGSWYVALGASSLGKIYIYKNPVNQLGDKQGILTPTYILKATNPNYLAFSANAEYIAIENGSQFSVYDARYDKGFSYDTGTPLDAPQAHATWMDGNRLTYISNGKLVLFDYDHANQQVLVAANSSFLPYFSTSYQFVDTLATNANGKTLLTATSLLTPADQ